jgi:formylglycine-generating enzyme required for sulfatase activity
MSSGLSRRLQLGIVFGLCATGMASAQRTPSAGASGSVIKDCAACPELLVVPAGQFLMGSPPRRAGPGRRRGSAAHGHNGQPFAAGKYEVTFDEWDACVAGAAAPERTTAGDAAGGL